MKVSNPSKSVEMVQTFTHETETTELQISIAYIRDRCNAVAGKPIPAPTFSRWCARFCVSGKSEDSAPLAILSGLITCALLHRFGARSFTGRGYKELYPLVHRRILEEFDVRPRDSRE
ncbi:hypothetical protein NIES2135_53870 [Leptolyngbya boryana NIES-2135]|uniref:Uncharacterized protein n=1 Tax=Leptolyngbya boryana NIES-2135 TaxID=1973484 RepID=A0A1Z4JP69_LEPBY|nr:MULTISPECIES: hypothetical protein [Leptolyngbya]BAY58514.1 hypothetical protein NIES2135_53870 [Leptolyngbya boryana NIES-2135]MBD2370989.1 hypothetical protein [Leptolyngbya sp. FACHB-161]MBD2377503.1 hypothetical protein [Leptolyngbya sp. FACHB-238]MBD2401912.1 hypothetical protein [Leptolyngbya sp. FACHB-239]MBD2408429.1 hypothetical protein [Leptolyngbya sp. FACHB-402]